MRENVYQQTESDSTDEKRFYNKGFVDLFRINRNTGRCCRAYP